MQLIQEMKLNRKILLTLYKRLYQAYGPQDWWPADTPFEIMVGAILTQNTAWTNVEKAIQNLKQADALNLSSLLNKKENELAELIRPSGYFNVKTRRLKHFAEWFLRHDKYIGLDKLETNNLRKQLLSVNGIGPETADDILLYAFQRPVFVIDAYTRRLLLALDLIKGDENYETLRQGFESSLKPDVPQFQEYHALIVRHAKQKCLKTKSCVHCLVTQSLPEKLTES